MAQTTVYAWRTSAAAHSNLTRRTRVADIAQTSVAVYQIVAFSIFAWIRRTLIYLNFTASASETLAQFIQRQDIKVYGLS